MTDLLTAIAALDNHTLSLCKQGDIVVSDGSGISPMMDYIAQGRDLSGYSVADIIVGRAAAMLFIKAGIKEVYAQVLSLGGKEVLDKFNIPYSYGSLTDYIINRSGSGVCPMETAVADIEDAEEAYVCLRAKLDSMRG